MKNKVFQESVNFVLGPLLISKSLQKEGQHRSKTIENPTRKRHQKSIDLLMDFASKMEPKIEPEIDKIKALTQLWAQMASERAMDLHFDPIMSHLTRFYEDF